MPRLAATRQVAAPRTCQESYHITLPAAAVSSSAVRVGAEMFHFLTCTICAIVPVVSSPQAYRTSDPLRNSVGQMKGQSSGHLLRHFLMMSHTPKHPRTARVVQIPDVYNERRHVLSQRKGQVCVYLSNRQQGRSNHGYKVGHICPRPRPRPSKILRDNNFE